MIAALVAALLAFGPAPVLQPVADASPTETARVTVSSLRPDIVWKPIPFGRVRRRETGGYSKRHYGTWTWHLTEPKVIVEHYTDGTSFKSAWNYMAANVKHLGEFPGVCSHFVIDTDGTIYQLARLDVRCRHVVGLNYTAIGIEHVGTSNKQVLGNRRQMRSSLRLTLWLMAKLDVNIGNVIGHAEALESPYHHELYPDWQCLVHSDFPHPAMKKYRTRLRDLAAAKGVSVGAGPKWVPSEC